MSTVVFRGLEGSNPLGFLAALGALRLFDAIGPGAGVRMRWIRDGGWRPEVSGLPAAEEAELCRLLHEQAPWAPLAAFRDLGKNVTVAPGLLRAVLRRLIDGTTAAERTALDFAAAFGSDVLEDEGKGRIGYTDLCFITGSGHQHFLGTAAALAKSAGPEHLREALFGTWRYADEGLSLRWDPDDAKEYALRWRDPSVGGVSSVWGANRLAFEALPLYPTAPAGWKVQTTGFRRQERAHEFTWPVWTQPAGLDTVRSLVGLRELREEAPDRSQLAAMGVEEVFRARRVRIGQGANFKVSFRPAHAV